MKQEHWTQETPYCIYVHTSPSNKVYVGKSRNKNLNNRWGKNGIGYKDSPIFWNAIQKYGWDSFRHEILKEGLTKYQANQLEQDLISKYKNLDQSYNIAKGGEGGHGKTTEETKRKISIANTGRKRTVEQKQKQSRFCKGMKHFTNGIINKIAYNEIDYEELLRQGFLPGRTIKINENRKNRIWINNGIKNIFITDNNKHLLNQYLESGYNYGFIQKSHQTPEEKKVSDKAKGHSHTNEMKQQKSETMKSYGYKWMTKDGISIRVTKTEHDKYLKNNWKFGRITKHDKKGRYIKI